MIKTNWTVTIIVVIVIAGLGFWYSGKKYDEGLKIGYDKAVADISAQQEESANKAADAAVSEANPFKVENPLEGVGANPFEKARETLNPFD